MGSPARVQIPRAERFPLTVPIHFRKAGTPHWLDGKTINISRTGILFQTNEIFSVNSPVDIRVKFPAQSMLECHGFVVRTDKSRIAVRIHHPNLLHQH